LRLLVVEDEPLTRATLVSFLEKEGHSVRQASCVASCRAALRSEPVDVVLLDLGLPGESGLDFARELRRTAECGVIVVSERAEVATRIAALDDGADDYLTKPVHLEELAARVRSVARRRSHAGEVVRIGPVSVDAAARRVEVNGQTVALTRGELDILLKLVEANGKIVSRTILSEVVARGEGDLRTVDALISRLRRKLSTDGAEPVIVTAPGFGYRLAAPPARS